jgi:hypothetical protein
MALPTVANTVLYLILGVNSIVPHTPDCKYDAVLTRYAILPRNHFAFF